MVLLTFILACALQGILIFCTPIDCICSVSDPMMDDSISVASGAPGEEELDDLELEAAANHLNNNFYCEILDEKEDDEEEERTATEKDMSPVKRLPLASLLGPLPTAASLGLTDSIKECIADKKDNSECFSNVLL